jgi:hypothetical protein
MISDNGIQFPPLFKNVAIINPSVLFQLNFQGDPIARMSGLNRWKLVRVQRCAATVSGEIP